MSEHVLLVDITVTEFDDEESETNRVTLHMRRDLEYVPLVGRLVEALGPS